MTGPAQSVSGSNGGLIDAFAAQIKTLQSDPNATDAYKKQLDQWMDQVKAATEDKGAAASPEDASVPAAPVTPQSLAPAALDNPKSSPVAPDPESNPVTTTVSPRPDPAVSSSGNVLSGPNVPEALKALAPAIESASQKTGVPVAELAAVIWAESRGAVAATSTNPGNGLSDSGLMQINPGTFGQLQSDHPELQGKSIADPATNILAGAYFLSDLHQQFGTWDLAQRAYNSGPLSVDRTDANVTTTGLGDPDYNRKVDSFREKLEAGESLPA